jgi:adenylate cyclase
VLPFLLPWSLGGFVASSGVALWGLIARSALMLVGPAGAAGWFAA